MSTQATLTLDSRILRNLPEPRGVFSAPVRSFPTLASKFDLLSEIVEKNWDDLPESVKELAKAYVYFHVEEEQRPSLLSRLRFAWFMFRNMTERDEISRLQTSLIRLSDAVFTVLERENPRYQSALEDALSDHHKFTPTNVEELREWMRRV